jgi:hypothetical protein
MSDPFQNPFCPTPNPVFNVLIKMVIPGATRPIINRLEGKIMDGQKYEREMYEKLMPSTDGGGARGSPMEAFLEMKMNMAAGGDPVNAHEGKVVPGMKKGMYKSLIGPASATLFTSLTKELHALLHESLHSSLIVSLRDATNTSITHAIEHVLGNTVALGVSQAVPLLLEKILPGTLYRLIEGSLTDTLTRSLTHTIGATLTHTLSKHRGVGGGGGGHGERYFSYYSSYFTDYYAEYYRKQTDDR